MRRKATTAPGTLAQRGMGCGSSQAAVSSAAKGWVIQQLKEHTGPINCSALSEDESLLITGSEDRTVKMWSTQSEPVELLGTLVGHTSYITQCSVHGSFVVSASADGTLKKWNISDASCVFTFHGHTARINRIVCNGNFIVSTSMDKTVRIWHFHAEKLSPPNPLEDIPDEIAGPQLVDEEFEYNEQSNLDLIEAAILARRLSMLSTSLRDDTITAKHRGSMMSGHATFTSYSDPSQQSFEEIQSQRKKSKRKECIQVLKGHLKGVFPVLYIPFERESPIDESNGNGPSNQENPQNDHDVDGDAFGPQGDLIVTGSFDCSARSWDLLSGRCLKVFKGHTQAVNDLAVDPGAEYLFTAGGDGTVRQWILGTGECKRILTGHQGPVVSLITHSKMLYSASADGTARSWVMEFGESTRVYRGALKTIESLRYYDRMLFTGSGDAMARMYEAKSGSHKRSFRGHEKNITCMEATRGRLFTGSYDGMLIVWDTTGVIDETVFGVDEESENSDEDEDDVNVQKAMKILDGFVHGT
ncbi:WD repeat-containing protein 86-like isoform X2 [Varroa destructor]|uniref:Uncharacterized protein n=1 Tax=Varroa destructor TaxID=109461 RepID=A0A7M7KRT0_VARDE|nr:WD repeat-containing protein 86-like isoform X2 [Varroa destructor]